MYFRCRGFYFCLPKTISFHHGRLIQVSPIRLFFGGISGFATYDSLLGGVNNNSVTAGMPRTLCPGAHRCPISPGVKIEIAS